MRRVGRTSSRGRLGRDEYLRVMDRGSMAVVAVAVDVVDGETVVVVVVVVLLILLLPLILLLLLLSLLNW